jgi:hypothetical protein
MRQPVTTPEAPSWNELCAAAGMLDRAATHLFVQLRRNGDDQYNSLACAIGILLGSAFQVRPSLVKLD